MPRSLSRLDFSRAASVVSATPAERRAATVDALRAKSAKGRADMISWLVSRGRTPAEAEAAALAKYPTYANLA